MEKPKKNKFSKKKGPPRMKGLGSGRGKVPPWKRGPFPDPSWAPEGNLPPWMKDELPDDMSWGNEFPGRMGGPFPNEMCGPWRGGPPDMGGPFPDEMGGPWRGSPPDMGPPFPDEMGGPWRGGPSDMGPPFPDEMCGRGRGRPPRMRGTFPGRMCRPRRGGPPQMGHPFPDERGGLGRHIPPVMGDPFPDEMCGPGRGGPFPDEMCGPGRGRPPHTGGPFPDEMCGPRGGMSPHMRGPFPDEMQETGRDIWPLMRGPCPDGMVGPRGNMPPEGRDHCWPEEREAEGNMPLPRNGPQTPDLWPSRSVPAPEGDLHQAGAYGARLQQSDARGLFCSNNESLPPGNRSSDQPLTSGKNAESMRARRLYLQESAAKILETFGLSTEDFNELCRYPDDQLKPENIPTILEDIRKRKRAGQSLSLPSKETFGRDGLYVSPVESEVSMVVQPTVPEPQMLLDSSEAEKMKNCPNPSVMNDYYSVSPKVFPHVCSLCKIECRHLKGWSLHLSTTGHSESCQELRQQYPDWNPEDSFWLKRYRGSKNTHHPKMRQSAGSSPECSGCSRPRTRSRSRSPRRDRTSRPTARNPGRPLSPTRPPAGAQPSQAAAAAPKETERPGSSKADHPSVLSKGLGHLEQPKDAAAGQEQEPEEGKKPLSNPPQLPLSGLVEKSVVQAMSLFQPGGTVTAGPGQGTSLTSLPPLQIDPEAVTKGLVSMMQMVATQVVQAVLASREVSGGQVSSGGAGVSSQPSDSTRKKEEDQKEDTQEQGVPSIPPQPALEERRDLGSSTGEAEAAASSAQTQEAAEEEEEEAEAHDGQEAEEPGAAGTSNDPGRCMVNRKRRILIIGHSFVDQAARFAAQSAWGSQLGLEAFALVEWKSQEGMRWAEVLPMALRMAEGGPPDLLLVHAGGNDLGKQTGKSLVMEITKDLASWKAQYPGAKVVWSNIVPRPCWDTLISGKGINRARRSLNREVCRQVVQMGGAVVGHPGISSKKAELYKPDGVDLSDAGLTVFLDDLRRGLQAEVGSLLGGHEA